MEIRRNSEGNMLYFDCKELVEAAVEHGILQQEEKDGEKYVAMYMGEGEQGAEGWYMVEKEDVIQMLMRDDEGINCLYDALKEKGVAFQPSLDLEMLNLMNHVFCGEQGPLPLYGKEEA